MEGAAIQKAGVIFCTLDHLLFKAQPVLDWCCYEWGFALLWLLLHRYDYCCYCEWGCNHVETSAAPLLHDPLMIRFLVFSKSFDICRSTDVPFMIHLYDPHSGPFKKPCYRYIATLPGFCTENWLFALWLMRQPCATMWKRPLLLFCMISRFLILSFDIHRIDHPLSYLFKKLWYSSHTASPRSLGKLI